MTNLEAALSYAARGWSVFPVRGKHPLTDNGFKDASTDPERIRSWWTTYPDAGIALATGLVSGFFVVDIDPRHGGLEAFEQLQAAHGAVPDTLAAATGGGGVHLLFTGTCPSTINHLGRGIDTRGDGGYIVAPPSRHPSGTRYEWANQLPIAEPPGWLVEALNTRKRDVAAVQSSGVAGDVNAAREALRKHGPAIEGNGGDKHTFVAGAILYRDYGLTDEQAWPLAIEWNSTCQPPWSEGDLRKKLGNAASYANGAPLLEEWDPEQDSAEPVDLAYDIHQTDVGNALRLERRFGADTRFVHDWGKWIVWEGNRWVLSDSGQHMRKVIDTVMAIQLEVQECQGQIDALQEEYKALNVPVFGDGLPDARVPALQRRLDQLIATRKALAKHAKDSQSAARLNAMVSVAESRKTLARLSVELDADPMLLGVANGTLDLTTGKLREAKREDLITKLSPVTYDPSATCPRWLQFLDTIMLADAELVSYLQQAIGYTLTGSVSEQVFFFLHGDGRNGKSVFTNLLLHLMGDYGRVGAKTLLEEDHSGNRHTTDLASLQGSRSVVLSETEESKGLPEAGIKRLTGGESVTARKLYRDDVSFQPTWKLWVAGNYKPEIKGGDLGIWRRIRCIPFRYTVPEGEQDKRLEEKLKAEAPGILAWAVAGCLAWQRAGLTTPKVVTEVMHEYRSEQDVVGTFLKDKTVSDAKLRTKAADLYTAYKTWCGDNGYRWPLTVKRFKVDMTRRGFTQVRHGVGLIWQGLDLVT